MKIVGKIKEYLLRQKTNLKNDFFSDGIKQNHKEGLSLFGILKMVKKNILVFLGVVISIGAFSIAYGVTHPDQNYYAVGQLSFKEFVHATLYTAVQEDVASDKVGVYVADILKEKNITHSNGKEITGKEITRGISTTHASDSNSIFVKFANGDETIVVTVANEVMDFIVDYYKDGNDGLRIYDFIFVGSYSSNTNKDVKQSNFYIFLGTIGGVLISFSIVLLIEKVKKTIYCPKDVLFEDINIITYPKNNKMKSNERIIQFNEQITQYFKNRSLEEFVIVPVGKTSDIKVNKIINNCSLLNNTSKVTVISNINKNNGFFENARYNQAYIFIFECGKCSMKDFGQLSKNEVEHLIDQFGIFID